MIHSLDVSVKCIHIVITNRLQIILFWIGGDLFKGAILLFVQVTFTGDLPRNEVMLLRSVPIK